ncbi:MAG: cupin domain-containing protein [Chloroflexota bacterium]
MERKEPYATADEQRQRIVRYEDVPAIELGPNTGSHLVSGGNITLSFVRQEPNSLAPAHTHQDVEQIMVVLEGSIDTIIDGKLYPMKKGDVAVLPPGVEHGAYAGPKGAHVVDVFSPPRKDLEEQLARKLGGG